MKKILNIITLFILISNNFFAQEDKTVELTTTGTGKTKEIAIHIALRSAIEQAFGVFISSKTEVLNDELLTDQIISVSNGNIQHYDIISEMPIDNNTSFAVTVKSKVSISKLTSFIESKGIEVEFKGAVFAMNIKQQKLNEESELKAIKEMAVILKKIADRSFDFEVAAAGEPTLESKDDWNIPLIIKIKLNKNKESSKEIYNADFEEFWNFYTPIQGKDGTFVSKGSKAEAKKVYERARKQFSQAKIMDALKAYLGSCHKNARFTKHASSWLNQAVRDSFEFEQSVAIQPQAPPAFATNQEQKRQQDQQIYQNFLKKHEQTNDS